MNLLATGEDGPTHADPQPLQLLAENFPAGCAISLTPFGPQEVWPLLAAALPARPALILPFVTRPAAEVLDRETLGLAPAEAAKDGLYRLRDCEEPDVVVVLQEISVAYEFVRGALPLLDEQGLDVPAYVSSAAGRAASLYPYRAGHYLGSGPGETVLAEAGLDGKKVVRMPPPSRTSPTPAVMTRDYQTTAPRRAGVDPGRHPAATRRPSS